MFTKRCLITHTDTDTHRDKHGLTHTRTHPRDREREREREHRRTDILIYTGLKGKTAMSINHLILQIQSDKGELALKFTTEVKVKRLNLQVKIYLMLCL